MKSYEERRYKRYVIKTKKTDDIYRFYRKNYKNTISNRSLFGKILGEFNSFLSTLIIEKSFIFHIPAKMGTLYIKRFPLRIEFDEDNKLITNRLRLNHKKCKELWRKEYPGLTDEEIFEIKDKPLIFHTNRNLDGDACRWRWNKRLGYLKYKSYFIFDPTRFNTRKLAKFIEKTSDINYFTT